MPWNTQANEANKLLEAAQKADEDHRIEVSRQLKEHARHTDELSTALEQAKAALSSQQTQALVDLQAETQRQGQELQQRMQELQEQVLTCDMPATAVALLACAMCGVCESVCIISCPICWHQTYTQGPVSCQCAVAHHARMCCFCLHEVGISGYCSKLMIHQTVANTAVCCHYSLPWSLLCCSLL